MSENDSTPPDGFRQIHHVVIDGVEYLPVSKANPNTEQIARGIMESFWGEIPSGYTWKDEASTLRVICTDGDSNASDPTVMEVVGRILNRITRQGATP